VRIEGLKSKPYELNGCTAVICGDFDPATGRWTVRLDTDNSLAQLLPQNMKLDAGATSSAPLPHIKAFFSGLASKMSSWKVGTKRRTPLTAFSPINPQFYSQFPRPPLQYDQADRQLVMSTQARAHLHV